MITHVNKGKDAGAIDRIIGSIGWGTSARLSAVFAPDRENPERCLMACPKVNMGIKPETLSYQIVADGEYAKVVWHGTVATTADEAMAGETREPRKAVAKKFLAEKFAEKSEWPSDEILEAAKKLSISRNAIWEAKAEMNVCAMKRGRNWHWWIPPEPGESAF